MNDKRFAPPQAAVADVRAVPEEPPPAKVVLAVRLLWAGWLASTVLMSLHRDNRLTGVAAIVVFAIGALYMAFAGYLNFCIGRGRNWARITTLVLTVLGFASVAFMPDPLGTGPTEHVLNVVGWVCDVAGVALLFAPTASAWFRRRAA